MSCRRVVRFRSGSKDEAVADMCGTSGTRMQQVRGEDDVGPYEQRGRHAECTGQNCMRLRVR